MEGCRDKRGKLLRPDGGESEGSGTLVVKIKVELTRESLCGKGVFKHRMKADRTIKICGPDSERFWWRVHDDTKTSSHSIVDNQGWRMLAGYKMGEFLIARQELEMGSKDVAKLSRGGASVTKLADEGW